MNNPPARISVVDEAKTIISRDRNDSYGSPEDNFRAIGVLWDAWRSVCPKGKYRPEHEVAIQMVLLKLGRIATGVPGLKDNYTDAIGYMACAYEQAQDQNIRSTSGGVVVTADGKVKDCTCSYQDDPYKAPEAHAVGCSFREKYS